MAEPPGGGEKTEAPSPKRLRDAEKKGDRPDLREAGVALVTLGGALWLLSAGAAAVDALGQVLRDQLSFGHAEVLAFDPAKAALRALLAVAGPLAILFALTIAGALVAAVVAGAGRPAFGKLAPDLKRLDPVAGFGRIFGRKGLTELGKALLKLVACGGVAFIALRSLLDDMLALGAAEPTAAIDFLGDRIPQLVLLLTAGLALIAVIDAPLALASWRRRLKMTKQEVREETKEQEGSPEVKQAQRRRQREASRAGVSAAVAGADVVVTNPAHFAVALRYRRAQDRAPVVVARGKGEMATMIRAAAAEGGITMLEYPELARALYFTSRRDGEIAPDLYAAVAVVLAFVFGLGRPGARRAAPAIDLPDAMRFDEDGRRR